MYVLVLGNVILAANPANLMLISGVTLVVAWIISNFLLVVAAFQNDKSMCLIPWLVIDPLVSICEAGIFVFVGTSIMKADQKRIGMGADYIVIGAIISGTKIISCIASIINNFPQSIIASCMYLQFYHF